MKKAVTKGIVRRLLSIVGHWAPLTFVVASFVGSRLYYHLALEVRFDATPLEHFIQFADVTLLRDDLLRTCFSLNHQAPLLNFLSGVALKIDPSRYGALLEAVFVVAGFGIALALFTMQKKLGVRPWVAAPVTAAYSASPPAVMYENWLIYHHLVSALMICALVALVWFLRRRDWISGFAFFSVLALIVLTRASFGLVFMSGAGLIVAVSRKVPVRLILKAAALPMLVIALYTARVPWLTGRSLGYALAAPNIAVKTLRFVPNVEREQLFESGKVSHLSELEPFFDLTSYPQYRVATPTTGYPALDQTHMADGQVNANALEYVLIADRYAADARALLTECPQAYFEAVKYAVTVGYFKAATSDVWAPRTSIYKAVAPADRRVEKALGMKRDRRVLGLRIGLPLILVWSLGRLLKRRSRVESARTIAVSVTVALFFIVYASAVAVLVSWDDFSRYRFEIDVVYAMLFGLMANDLVTGLFRAWSFAGVLWTARRGGVSFLARV